MNSEILKKEQGRKNRLGGMLQCKSTTSSMEMDKITVPEKVKQGKTLRDQLKEQVMLTRLSGSAELVSAECLE